MSLFELWTSGAIDAFGYRFRDVWHVRGWEEGRVPADYVCELYCDWEPRPIKTVKPETQQMELFA